MKRRLFLRVILLLLLSGMLATMALQFYASRIVQEGMVGNAMISGSKLAVFMIWGVLPYLSLLAPVYVVDFPKSALWAFLIAVVLIVGLGLYGYVHSIFFPTGTRGELIFFTMPLCQLFGASVACGCIWLFHRKRRWREKQPML